MVSAFRAWAGRESILVAMMANGLELYRAAWTLLDAWGFDGADAHALRREAALLDRGDREGAFVWACLRVALKQLNEGAVPEWTLRAVFDNDGNAGSEV